MKANKLLLIGVGAETEKDLDREEDILIVGKVHTIQELLEYEMNAVDPDVILMDGQLIQGAQEVLGWMRPSIPFIVLTASSDEEGFLEAISHGAAGYVEQRNGIGQLISSIRQCADGQMIYPLSFKQTLLDRIQRPNKSSPKILSKETEFLEVWKDLSVREKELLMLLSEGHTNQQIAETLYLSIGTVKNYISKLYKKLQVTCRPELMAFLFEAGLNRLRE